MLSTFGLTHIALSVSDLDRSVFFYSTLIGAAELFRDENMVELGTPGAHDAITLELASPLRPPGEMGTLAHFGFRLREPTDNESVVNAVTAAGGSVVEEGEFVPGEPFVFARDPDGYVLELWYEPVKTR